MKFVIEKDSAQNILNYLQTRPYADVFQLIPLLVGLEPLQDEDKTEGEDKD